jgi:hypothetical protein
MGSREALREKLKSIDRRDKAVKVRNRLLDGLFIGLSVGVVLALVDQLDLLSHNIALTIPVSAVVVSLLWTLPALFAKTRPDEILIAADRRLGLKERLSTAYEVLESKNRAASHSPFAPLVLEDAAAHTSGMKSSQLHPGKMSRRLKYLPLLLAAVLVLSLFNFGFSLRAFGSVADPEVSEVGKEIEQYGKRLAARAEREGLPETQDLAERMKRLGEDLQTQRLGREETVERIQRLSERASQQAQNLGNRRTPDRTEQQEEEPEEEEEEEEEQQQDGSQGSPQTQMVPGGSPQGDGDGTGDSAMSLGPGSGEPEESQETSPGGPPDEMQPGDQEGEAPAEPTPDQTDSQEQDNLGAASQMLSDAAGSLGEDFEDGEEVAAAAPAPAPPEEGEEEERQTEETQPAEDEAEAEGKVATSGRPGEQAVEDERGESSAPTSPQGTGPISQLTGEQDKGEVLRIFVRSLPTGAGSGVPEGDIILEYQKQMEEVVRKEEIPSSVEEYVRDYFLRIGVSQE